MKQRILALLLAGLMALCLAACGAAADPQPQEETEPAGETAEITPIPAGEVKIGLLLDGSEAYPYDDNHIQGLRAACEALGIDYDTQVEVRADLEDGNACAEAVSDLLEAGCQILFSASGDFEPALTQAAGDRPDVWFCTAIGSQSGTDGLDNTCAYYARVSQARYLAGMAAGLQSKTGKLGYVAALPFPEVISGYTAYYLGARSVNPNVTMLVRYTNQWADETAETAAAQALIDQGCDVISHHTDTAIPVDTAQRNGVFAVGYNRDLREEAPDAALTSVQIDWGVYYQYALECLVNGEAIDQVWLGDWAQGACRLTDWNEAILADGVKEAVEAAAGELSDGSRQVFTGPLHGTDADGNELTLAPGEVFSEEEDTAAPTFDYLVDGIIVLS